MTQQTVLVTGATGLIAKYCIRELIARGYRVRGTVRSLPKALAAVRAAGVPAGDPRLSFVEADLAYDTGWEEAVAGCQGVLHVASPFPLSQPRNRDELVRPAREGALRVLEAAAQARVRRVVMTSSSVAIMYPAGRPSSAPLDETSWTDPTRTDISPYIASKTLAERAAWEFVRERSDAPELVAINPGFVLGPALDADLSTSHEVIRLMLKGKYPAVPRVSYPIADVRDVALAHVAALERPAAKGERFIVANGSASFLEMALMLRHKLPELASRLPRFELPDLMVRGMAVADRGLIAVLPDLGARRSLTNAKAAALLGLQFRTVRDAVESAGASLVKLNVV